MSRRVAVVVLVLAAAVLVGCGQPVASAVPGAVWSPVPRSVITGCHTAGGLPDPACTPGAVDPRVTQANIGTTICRAGYTATVLSWNAAFQTAVIVGATWCWRWRGYASCSTLVLSQICLPRLVASCATCLNDWLCW